MICPTCGTHLDYQGHIAAPGSGVSYKCPGCEKQFVAMGSHLIDCDEVPTDQAPPWELTVWDVI